jgi:hypothetical protein
MRSTKEIATTEVARARHKSPWRGGLSALAPTAALSPRSLAVAVLLAVTLLIALWQIMNGSYRLSIRWSTGQMDLEPPAAQQRFP